MPPCLGPCAGSPGERDALLAKLWRPPVVICTVKLEVAHITRAVRTGHWRFKDECLLSGGAAAPRIHVCPVVPVSALAQAPAAPPLQDAGGAPPSMVARMTLIMEAFQPRNVKLLLDEIAARAHLPRSTTHRILDQLAQMGWLEHTPEGYGMGWRSLRYSGLDNGHSQLRAEAAPLLHSLSVRTGMVAHLAVMDGANVHYLDKIGGPSAVSVPSRVGGSAPAHATALGKAMLAWMNPETVDELFRDGLSPATPLTIADQAALYAELHRVRQRGGIAYEMGESFAGIGCVAAAVRSRREPVASISLVGRAGDPLERVAPMVLHVARQVSAALYPAEPLRQPARL